MEPVVRFARTADGCDIAYSYLGRGRPIVTVSSCAWTHATLFWRLPPYRQMAERLAANFRFVRYDSRGAGLSRSAPADYSLDARLRDLEAVHHAIGAGRCAFYAATNGNLSAIAYAALHPEQVSCLILARPISAGRELVESRGVRGREVYRQMGDAGWSEYTLVLAASLLGYAGLEITRDVAHILRETITPEANRMFLAQLAEIDVGDLLPRVEAPALLLCTHDHEPRTLELAGALRGAEVIISPVPINPFWLPEAVLGEVEAFLLDHAGPATPGVPEPKLSLRETEVLKLIAAGLTNREMADELSISVRTIGRHVTNIYDKIGARGKADATAYAIRHGLS